MTPDNPPRRPVEQADGRKSTVANGHIENVAGCVNEGLCQYAREELMSPRFLPSSRVYRVQHEHVVAVAYAGNVDGVEGISAHRRDKK